MTTTAYTVIPTAENTTASDSYDYAPPTGSRPPASIEGFRFLPIRWLPTDQEYYWSADWQAGEQETLRELAAGGGVEFDNTADLMHWLFSADE